MENDNASGKASKWSAAGPPSPNTKVNSVAIMVTPAPMAMIREKAVTNPT